MIEEGQILATITRVAAQASRDRVLRAREAVIRALADKAAMPERQIDLIRWYQECVRVHAGVLGVELPVPTVEQVLRQLS